MNHFLFFLLGFRSRWMMPFAFKNSIPREISNAKLIESFRSRGFGRVLNINFWRVLPSMSSVIIIKFGSMHAPINCHPKMISAKITKDLRYMKTKSDIKGSITWTTFSCLILESNRTSLWNLLFCSMLTIDVLLGWNIFTETGLTFLYL